MEKPDYKDVTITVLFDDPNDCFDTQDVLGWEGEAQARRLIEDFVHKDLDKFEQFMQTLGTDKLAMPERAILKTYLGWKLGMVAPSQPPSLAAQ